MKQLHHLGTMAKKKSEAAGAKIGASMKKAVSLASIPVIKISKPKIFGKKNQTESQDEKPELLKNELEPKTALKQSHVQVPTLQTQEYDRNPPSINDSSGKSAATAENEAYDVATECLTCENLIHCDFRGKSSAASERHIKNSSSCPFATQPSTKSHKTQ